MGRQRRAIIQCSTGPPFAKTLGHVPYLIARPRRQHECQPNRIYQARTVDALSIHVRAIRAGIGMQPRGPAGFGHAVAPACAINDRAQPYAIIEMERPSLQ